MKEIRGNLFIGASNKQLKECYESYKRVLIGKRNKKELFDEMVSGYIDRIETDDDKRKDMAAFAVARDHMYNEIARRYFKVCDGLEVLFLNNESE